MGIRVAELAWIQQPGAAIDIGIGLNGAVWVIGTDPVPGGYGVYYWNGSDWNSAGGGGVRIAVAPDGTPWVVSDVGNIYVLSGGNWQQLPGAATDIGVGTNGAVWAIGTDPVAGGYGIYYWNGSDWNSAGGGGVRIAVSHDGTPWVVNDVGNIFILSGGNWQQLPGAAIDIGIAINTAWVIGTNPVVGGYGIYYWESDRQWTGVDGGAVSISGVGAPWVVSDSGAIFSSQVAVVDSPVPVISG
jgi:Tectonin domain